jgi:hypothetical protein
MGFLGPLGILLVKTYFITVTNRSVYIHSGPRVRNSPEKLVHVIPRSQAKGLVARVKRGSLWNALFLQFPGDAKPTRVNISHHSRSDMDSFLEKFPEVAVGA